MDQYASQYRELIKQSNTIKSATENSNQSEKDFNQEIEKIKVEADFIIIRKCFFISP